MVEDIRTVLRNATLSMSVLRIASCFPAGLMVPQNIPAAKMGRKSRLNRIFNLSSPRISSMCSIVTYLKKSGLLFDFQKPNTTTGLVSSLQTFFPACIFSPSLCRIDNKKSKEL